MKKIELIMSELYKNKRVLFNDSNEDTKNISNQELNDLKEEIAFFKRRNTKFKE